MQFKKTMLLCLTLLLTFSLMVGCARNQNQQPNQQENNNQNEQPQQPPQNNQETNLEDGIYTDKGEQDERGWTPIITIIVRDGKMDNVFYDEIDEEGEDLKSFDAEYAINMKEKSGELPYTAGRKLADSLKATGNPDQVDNISGATGTSESFKNLAQEALEKNPKPLGETFPDGIYKAESEEDERGYKSLAAIVINEGKVSTIEYDEYHEQNNSFKTEDEEYAKNMKEKSGVTPEEAVENLISQLREKEDPKDVDDVAGATGTSNGFKDLMTKVFSYIKK
ncbi:FMN-binding protein [Irregularibacter muris]|uniref:FMN-binding protein n=1 Tax=Irregularibacter muris TaxID=1796619 RepID=A0AAE3HI71_9FIRM|nr:FMN-binding protein [Irregularibacter muris]MCR1899904.1 FMN-binding protein [Irregularibacter muris]